MFTSTNCICFFEQSLLKFWIWAFVFVQSTFKFLVVRTCYRLYLWDMCLDFRAHFVIEAAILGKHFV